jgi:hypothetical protein
LVTQGDGDETRAAQGAFLKELGMVGDDPVNGGLSCGLAGGIDFSANPRKEMVGPIGFESTCKRTFN